jgi:flagellar protein FliO/FliZ
MKNTRTFLCAIFYITCFFISTANAELAETKTTSASQLANLLGGLVLMVGLIYGLSWFVRRFNQGGFMQNSTIKMLATMPLGTRERLMLVDVGGKQILLGITAQSINSLHVFETPIVTAADASTKSPSDFSQKLMALLQKKELQKKELQKNNNVTDNSVAPKNINQ